MNKNIGLKRLYKVGDFNNITFEESINEIPENIFNNKEVMDDIKYLLLVDAELGYRRYIQLYQELAGATLDDAIEALEKTKLDTLKEIKDILDKE